MRKLTLTPEPSPSCLKCDRKVWAKDLCLKHYKRQWRHGSADTLLCAPNDMPLEERLTRVGWVVTETGCWEWKGRRFPEGYGAVSFANKDIGAHRAAYEVWVGPIPDGMLIRHKCDNPPCINPAHLEPGTKQSNADDMVERGRSLHRRGSDNATAKLTEEGVLKIRYRYSQGETLTELSRVFNVTPQCIFQVVRRKSWQHV